MFQLGTHSYDTKFSSSSGITSTNTESWANGLQRSLNRGQVVRFEHFERFPHHTASCSFTCDYERTRMESWPHSHQYELFKFQLQSETGSSSPSELVNRQLGASTNAKLLACRRSHLDGWS